MAALILGRLLTRPDMGAPLADFITWSRGALRCTDAVQAPFLVPGVCECVHVCMCLNSQKHVRMVALCCVLPVLHCSFGRTCRLSFVGMARIDGKHCPL